MAGAQCGHIQRPVDPTGAVTGTLSIGFALFKHSGEGPAVGTIVATEGGPGFPTTGTRESYLALFAPLLGDHDLLLVDNRGTGRSTPIDCRTLQTIPVPTVQAVGDCGRTLGKAADFYGSPMVADDLAAVLDALGIAKIDLYGDSYGTFTAQIFAQRHPDRLRSLVLDGAFATRGESGFFPNTPAAIRRNIDLVCDRSPACHALPGTALARLDRLLTKLRTAPIHGVAPDNEGHKIDVTVDPVVIGTILYDATYDPVNLRELDAATRAVLDRDDPLPLLRLAAETVTHAESRDSAGDAANFSYGLFAAVSCMDYPQIYDMRLPPASRRTARDAVLAVKRRDDPGIYAPLTIDEWRAMPLDYSILDLCLDWPVENPPYPPGQPVPPSGVFADVPTLVLSGELDTTTPSADAVLAMGAFPNARHVVLANSFHVDALDDETDCAAAIVRRFVAKRDPGDVSCIDRIPAIRPVTAFARHAAATPPAKASDGNRATVRDLAIAAAAVETAGDVLDRTWRNAGGAGLGLRGGEFQISRDGDTVHCTLRQVRWAEDLPVSGQLDLNRRTNEVRGDLIVEGATIGNGKIAVLWNAIEPASRASMVGTIGNRPIHAWRPAP